MYKDDNEMSESCKVVGHSQVANILRRMNEEMRTHKRFNGYIDQLQFLISNREDSVLKGLEEKLQAVGRGDEMHSAARDLLWFEMMLEKLTHYQSAQRLFFYFLARILNVFETKIMPASLNLTREEVEAIIEEEIIKPTLSEMDEVGGHEHLLITPSEIRGMINWLAERCHIRWQSC